MPHHTTCAIAALTLAAGTAAAQSTLATFDFDDMDASYDASLMRFTATSVAQTEGEVEDFTTSQTAVFGAGFVSGPSADFTWYTDLSNITSTTADGVGSFTITDFDGDTITGDIAGTWTSINTGGVGFAFLASSITNVQFDSSSGDGMFEGTSGQFANLSGSLAGAFSAFIGPGPSQIFQKSFVGVSASAQGVILPTPAATGLLGLGGLVMLRRRR